ncbi:MAG TPA: VanZ family protein [Steroidobacteraceae bacterium]|nr:VanZ family protein [Steroidobacteraceae bacterium]
MSMLRDLRFVRWWLLGGWLAVIAAMVVCLVPGKYVETPGLNDKVEHATGFVLLTLWFCSIYRPRRYWMIALYFLLFGVFIEVMQGAMPFGRDSDIHDVYADAAGIVIGVVLALTPLSRWPQWIEAVLSKKNE